MPVLVCLESLIPVRCLLPCSMVVSTPYEGALVQCAGVVFGEEVFGEGLFGEEIRRREQMFLEEVPKVHGHSTVKALMVRTAQARKMERAANLRKQELGTCAKERRKSTVPGSHPSFFFSSLPPSQVFALLPSFPPSLPLLHPHIATRKRAPSGNWILSVRDQHDRESGVSKERLETTRCSCHARESMNRLNTSPRRTTSAYTLTLPPDSSHLQAHTRVCRGSCV